MYNVQCRPHINKVYELLFCIHDVDISTVTLAIPEPCSVLLCIGICAYFSLTVI